MWYAIVIMVTVRNPAPHVVRVMAGPYPDQTTCEKANSSPGGTMGYRIVCQQRTSGSKP